MLIKGVAKVSNTGCVRCVVVLQLMQTQPVAPSSCRYYLYHRSYLVTSEFLAIRYTVFVQRNNQMVKAWRHCLYQQLNCAPHMPVYNCCVKIGISSPSMAQIALNDVCTSQKGSQIKLVDPVSWTQSTECKVFAEILIYPSSF